MPGADQERASEAKEAIAELGRVATLEELESWIEQYLDLLVEEVQGELEYLKYYKMGPLFSSEDDKEDCLEQRGLAGVAQQVAFAITAATDDKEDPIQSPVLVSMAGKNLPPEVSGEKGGDQIDFLAFFTQKLIDSGKLDNLSEEGS